MSERLMSDEDLEFYEQANDILDVLEDSVNLAVNSLDLPCGWQCWSEPNGWEFIHENGVTIKVSIEEVF